MFGGVFAGTTYPYHDPASYPGTPDSLIVGRWGSIGVRFSPLVAIARSFRDSPPMNGSIAGMGAIVMSTCPEMRSTIDGPLPLYGTWTMLVLVMLLKSSVAMCVEPPVPPDA